MGLHFNENYFLAPLTWWKVGGPADWFCEPESYAELCQAFSFAKMRGIAVNFLGGGSNVLVSDEGVEGLVISTKKLADLQIQNEASRFECTALCGTPKAQLLKVFLERKLMPAVFLTGLPGDVAGGVVMNAGVGASIEPREFGELVDWVEVLRDGSADAEEFSPSLLRIDKRDLRFDYRQSTGWQPGCIWRVGLSWENKPTPEVPKLVREYNRKRLSTQPLQLPSCGSVFRNPLPFKAGQLIEELGLKGHCIGGAQISEKHANFIVNINNAKASDILALIELIKAKVKSQKSIDLETEVRWLGRRTHHE